jgi:hypothetical protein
VAAAVSVVEREEIEFGAPALVGDVLQDIPGVVVQRAGSPGNREDIKIRGGLAPHTLVLIDGFPVNSPTVGFFDVSSLPADAFERIEVVRGSQSALYGSNAIGGVVNFIPRKGDAGMRYGIDAGAGSFDTVQGGGFVQGGGVPGSFHLGVTGFTSNGDLPNDDATLLSALGTGEAAIGRKHRFHAVALFTDQEKEIPVDFGTARDVNHESDRRGAMGGLRWEADVAKGITITASGMIFDEEFHEADPGDPGSRPSSSTAKRIPGKPCSASKCACLLSRSRPRSSGGVHEGPGRQLVPVGLWPQPVSGSITNRSVFVRRSSVWGAHRHHPGCQARRQFEGGHRAQSAGGRLP